MTIRENQTWGQLVPLPKTNFANQPHFLLHEVMHMIYPASLNGDVNLDTALVDGLGLDRISGITDSELLTRYFNSGCDSKYGGPILFQ